MTSRSRRGLPWMVATAAAALVVFHAAWCVLVPAGSDDLTLVDVVPGTPISRIAKQLRDAGVIRSALYFHVLARLARKPLKAGEYGFGRTRLVNVLRALQEGRVYLHRFLVREGDSLAQIAVALERDGLADPDQFMRVAAAAPLLSELGVPAAHAEGYLFPDTYYLPKHMPPAEIVAVMVRRFFEKVPEELIDRGERRGLSLRRLVTFASIVEKEARVPEERPIIAAVFHNRLKREMLLQADPTVLYALRRWNWKLSYKDLQINHPYNTYRRHGLPPGPICSPGLACLEASVEPAKVTYLYFVTRKDGTNRHAFSKTFAAHERAVRKSRALVRERE